MQDYKHVVQLFIETKFTIMMLVRAEREGDCWSVQMPRIILCTCKLHASCLKSSDYWRIGTKLVEQSCDI